MADENAPGRNEKRASRYDDISDIIVSDKFGAGERASLRRNDGARAASQSAFFRLMADKRIDVDAGAAPAWGAIVHAIAQTAQYGHLLPAGTALASAGLSEARFAKLMAAGGGGLLDQIAIVARYLAAKQTAIGWTDLADLALADHYGDDDRADRLRFRVAQDFYRELHKLDQQKSS